jgi:glycosyltransferase involved in cell wall biosynthesis
MKILLISLLKRRLGPEITASRPHIIYEIASGLVKKGHDVSILGTADSVVEGAKIIPIIPKAFIDLPPQENPFYAETAYLVQLARKVQEIAPEFNIIHNHTYPEFINLLIAGQIKTPMVTTVHAQATKEFDDTLSLFPDTNLVSLSKAHQRLFSKTKFIRIVYNGVDTSQYAFSDKDRKYLLWLGRLSKARNQDGSFMDPKGIRWAIELARQTGENLLLSGNIEDMDFYDKDIKPFLSDKIKWIGPISREQALTRAEIISLMQGAKAFLMTINWEEPFGLVMTESMSCGTPVIGFNRGSVSEIIVEGKTGFIVDPNEGVEGLKKAVLRLSEINHQDCRDHVVNNFSLEKMVENYEKLYQEIINKNK